MSYSSQQKRRVWKSSKAGAIRRLKLVDEFMVRLAPGEVCISVKAIGLNFADIFALAGLYSATPKGAFIPGLEFSGVVESVSDELSDYRIGDKVMGLTRFGGYASHINIRHEYLQPLPDEWDFQQGAAYLVQTLTAWYALMELGKFEKGQKVLVHSAAGGVGLQAIKLVTAMGGIATGTVRSKEKEKFLRQQGFDKVLVREKNFAKQLKDSQLNFDLVLDAIGGAVQKGSFDALNPMGRLVVFGAAEFTPGKNRPHYLKAGWQYLTRPKYDVMDMIGENKSVMAFNLIWLWEQVSLMVDLISDMQKISISPPHVGHVYDFEKAHDAIQCLRGGNTHGKVVLTF
ncbi:MAG: zinc-binding dehydrogenase [Pseudomonadales bacterium]|nr:zinc-binding dehydrogenase [Pseudomonadales bacterium]